jgi:hypothetical protein
VGGACIDYVGVDQAVEIRILTFAGGAGSSLIASERASERTRCWPS